MQPEEILKISRDVGAFAAIEQVIRASPTPLEALKSLHAAMRDAYWKHKNLVETIALGRAIVQHGLTAALAAADEKSATNLRAAAKAAAYDIASFTWSGWDEPGIAITPS